MCTYITKLEEILNNPDQVYVEFLMKNTIWIVKNYNVNVKVTLKLITCDSKSIYLYNSIIQMQLINSRRLNKYVEKKKIIKVFDINTKK